MFFKVTKRSKTSRARRGLLKTRHGEIKTPFFMPIATKAAVKSLVPEEIKDLGAQIILSNTYHLYLRPGLDLIKKAGGLHKFMKWSGPILTDSGGFQVFSLAKLRKIKRNGVEFRSNIDGSRHFLTPEKAIKIQQTLGSDIMMVLDECTPFPATKEYARKSMELTEEWARRCKLSSNRVTKLSSNLLFGIVQGSTFKDLRQEHAKQIVEIGFDGYAIGGLAVGEPEAKMYEVVDYTAPLLPEDRPRYFMGGGKPEQLVELVKMGIDMFDCVIPTRNARHGMLYLWKNKQSMKTFARTFRLKKTKPTWYQTIQIKNAKFTKDLKPIDPCCDCYTCQNFSRAYLRHLFQSEDPLALRLATIHNLRFYLTLMGKIRKAI